MTDRDDDISDSTPEEFKKVKKIWKEYENRYEAIEALEYDGVNGLPPDWIPESTIRRFRQTRNYFLKDYGYTPELLKQRIDYYCENGIPPFHIHPNQKPVDRAALNLLLGFLANLRWVAEILPEDGLREIAGMYAARDYRRLKNLSPRGKSRLTVLVNLTFRNLLQIKKEKPTLLDVINGLESYDAPESPIIEEIDSESEIVYWEDNKGRPKQTGFRQIGNLLTQIRKESI